jgi:hypothetical protein
MPGFEEKHQVQVNKRESFLYLYKDLKNLLMTPGGVAVIVIITMIIVLIALFGDMLKSK